MRKCLISALAIILCAACGQKKEINPSTEFAQYIKAYTGGTISSASNIRIVFNDEALGALSNNGQAIFYSPDNDSKLNKLFDFSPSLKGEAHWISSSEIEFVPEEGALKSGRIYNASFKLGELVDVSEGHLKKFEFSFRVLPKALSIEIEGVEISADDTLHASVSGVLHSNTKISTEQAREFLKFKYPKIKISGNNATSNSRANGNDTNSNGSNNNDISSGNGTENYGNTNGGNGNDTNSNGSNHNNNSNNNSNSNGENGEPELKLDGSESGCQFRFTISGLGRNNKENSLFLTADGSGNGFDRISETEVKVPALGQFRVLSSAMRSDGNGHYIELRFSAPLDESASDDGLIGVEGVGACNLLVRNNVVLAHLSNINAYGGVQLHVSPAVQDIGGRRLKTAFKCHYDLDDIVPAVEFCLKGHILPDNSLLVLPFRTRGLCAVDVRVVRIFESNVLAFIQSNGLDGNNEIRRYGRLVYNNTVHFCNPNDINTYEWTENTLDLSSMFKQEPGAIYRIRLSFKRDYTIYAHSGADSGNETFLGADATEEEGGGTIARVGDNDRNMGLVKMGKPEGEDVWDEPSPYMYYSDYDWDEYDWKERNNPALPTFYMNSDRYPECNLISSNVGIVAKKSHGNKLWVSVADILEADPVSGALVVAYNYQLQEIGRAKTDSDGFAELDCKGVPFIVKACLEGKGSNKSGKETSKAGEYSGKSGAGNGQSAGYLKVTEAEAISLSRFDTGGALRSLGLKGFVYGERGVWRPGDTLHLSLMIEGASGALPENHPVIAELYNARGQFHSKMVCNRGMRGLYTFNMPTMANDPTGIWNVYFKYGGSTFHKALHVETVKPNRLKVNLSFDSDILIAGEPARYELSASWLTGPVASNLKFSSSITLSKLNRPFKGYENYVFNNPLSSFSTITKELVSNSLNENGKFAAVLGAPAAQEAPGMLNASIVTQVFENGGDASINTVNVRYAPFKSFTGIKLASDSDKGYNGVPQYETDTDLRFPVIVLSPEGKPVAGHRLEYAIYKLKWSWWWENHEESLDSYVHGSDAQKVASGELVSAAEARAVPFKVEYPKYGRYLVYVKDMESGHSSGGIFYVDWPSWRGRSLQSDPDALQMLTFTTDKKSYEPGEEAVVFIPSAAGGRALVSLENGSGVISRQWVATKEDGTKFKIKITKDMAPNFYVHITLLQPHKRRNNDLPIRMYGVQPVLVQDKDSRLEPVLSVPDVLRPQQEFSLSVKEKHGRPMAYTIAIVDDGLLDLTNFKTPDPWSKMNEREALGVRTWDLYDNVIGAYSGKFSPIAGIGGDEDKIVGGRKENRFNPVVRFIGPFTLDHGTATHKITLPMYVGSVRFMVVACDTKKYGSCEKTVPVRSPLMVLSSLPASIACGETLSLPVNVFAMEKDVRKVQVTVKAEGAVSILGTSSQSLSFTGDGDKIASFRLAASTKEGSARITIDASCGQHKAQEIINIDVLNNQPDLSTQESVMLEAGASHVFGNESGSGNTANPIAASIVFEPDTYNAALQVSTFPAVDFRTMFNNMYHYRYTCTEQILSKGITALYLKDLLASAAANASGSGKNVNSNGSQKKGTGGSDVGSAHLVKLADEMVNQALRELYSRQNSAGGFVYWPGQGTNNEWVTAMAGHFMAKAASCGYNVNKSVFEAWKEFELQQANAYMRQERKLDDLMQSYRLYALALAGKPADGAMNRLKASDNISVQAAWRLAAAYALAGKKSIATELIERLNTKAEDNSQAWYWFGSQARDNAMMLESALLAGDMMRAMPLAKKLEAESASWSSNTQFCAFASVALNLLAQKIQKVPIYLDVNYIPADTFAGNANAARNGSAIGSTQSISTTANLAELDVSQYGNDVIEVRNNGKSAVYVTLVRSGKPVVAKTFASGNSQSNAVGATASANAEKLNIYRIPESSSNLKLSVSYFDAKGNAVNPAKLKQGEEFSAEIGVQGVNNITSVNNVALDMAVPSGWEIFNERLFLAGSGSENCTYKDIRDNRIIWYFNLPVNGICSFRTKLRAAYAGEFVLPAIKCEAMYDPLIHANTASGSATVEP